MLRSLLKLKDLFFCPNHNYTGQRKIHLPLLSSVVGSSRGSSSGRHVGGRGCLLPWTGCIHPSIHLMIWWLIVYILPQCVLLLEFRCHKIRWCQFPIDKLFIGSSYPLENCHISERFLITFSYPKHSLTVGRGETSCPITARLLLLLRHPTLFEYFEHKIFI